MLTQFHKMSANYFRHVKKNLKYCSVIPKNFFFGPLQLLIGFNKRKVRRPE